jgi:ribonuclease HI
MVLLLPTGPCGAGASIFLCGSNKLLDLGYSLGHGTNNIAELYALGIIFVRLTALCAYYPTLTVAHVFSDSMIAINAATAKKKPLANSTLISALRNAYDKLPPTLTVMLHWVRGHSKINGNERVDKISKIFASVDNNSLSVLFDGMFRAQCFEHKWESCYSISALPSAFFEQNLPVPRPVVVFRVPEQPPSALTNTSMVAPSGTLARAKRARASAPAFPVRRSERINRIA